MCLKKISSLFTDLFGFEDFIKGIFGEKATVNIEDFTDLTVCNEDGEELDMYTEVIPALEKSLNVKITSIHSDGCERPGVWIAYVDTNKDYILVASNGKEIDHTAYSSKDEAYEAMRKATAPYLPSVVDCSWIGEDSAYLDPADSKIDEPWCWTIIERR